MSKSLKLLIIIIAIIIIFLVIHIFTKKSNDPQILSLTIDDVKINDSTMNNRLSLTGTINLSIDDKKYDGVSLEGYCLDTGNKRYNIYGPQDGTALYHNGSSNLQLSEVLDEDFGVDWTAITIKYCKIDTMKAYKAKSNGLNGLGKLAEIKEFDLNYEKSFN